MKPDFQKILHCFNIEGDFLSADIYGTGHINDSYAVKFEVNGEVHSYLLQRINHHVFKDPEGLMKNIEVVTSYLRKKIVELGGDEKRETLTLVPTIDGKYFIKTDEGEYWRAYLFIENACTYEVVDSLDHVYHAGKAFGNFQKLMSGFPADQLKLTIPDFHNTSKRYNTFLEVVDRDIENRVGSCQFEIDFVNYRAAQTSVLVDMLENDQLPERVTHNDTKFNNVMIDNETGEGICVIDLDTVMPGLSLYDFGDSIRSMANPVAEDEQDITKVNFDLNVFDFYARGYLETTRNFLIPLEIEQLPFSAIQMTFECGMRFLTDHLQGDTYYKTHRFNHNLDRCRTQFKLVKDMEEQYDEMVKIVTRNL